MLRNLFASISDSFSASVKPARTTKPRQTVFYVAVVLITLSLGSGASEDTDGVWVTEFGKLILDGSVGTYQLEEPEGQIQGSLSGQIKGRVYTGQWKEERGEQQCEDGQLWGAFSFEFNEDYSAFKGSFGLCEEESQTHSWNGVRYEPPIHIDDVTIDYGPWRQALSNLEHDRFRAQREFQLEEQLYQQANQRARRSVEAFSAAAQRLNQSRSKLLRAERAVKALSGAINSTAYKQAAERLRQLDAAHFELRKATKMVERDLELSEAHHFRVSQSYFAAEAAYQKIASEFLTLANKGAPLITEINSLDFRAAAWAPAAEIQRLDKTIEDLAQQMRFLASTRRRYRAELNWAVSETARLGERYVDAIHRSIAAQYLVEAGFLGVDMYKASEGGPFGLLLATTKKMVEIAIFKPSYYDATFSVGDAGLATLSGLPKTLAKRGIKTATTDYGAKLIAAKYLNAQGKIELDVLWSTFMTKNGFDDAMRTADPEFFSKMTSAIAKMIGDQRKQIETSEKALDILLRKNGFAPLAKTLGAKFLQGLAKDLSKEVLKKAAAEFFEGAAFQTYMKEQAVVSATARKLLRASSMHWTDRDLYDKQVKLRDQIKQQYDADAQLKIVSNPKFAPKARYEFRFSDNHDDAFTRGKRDLSVKLGGVELQRYSNTMVFLLPPDIEKKLKPSKDGGVKMEITVHR